MAKEKKVSKTFLKKWVKALRSGKYRQAANALFGEDINGKKGGFCCLGVAASIAMHDKGITLREAVGNTEWNSLREENKDGHGDNYRRMSSYGDVSDELLPGVDRGELICMNDDGKSFSQIADHIEKTYITKK